MLRRKAANRQFSFCRRSRLGVDHSGGRPRPETLIWPAGGTTLVLDVKDLGNEQDRAKRTSLKTDIDAVNAKGDFGVPAAHASARAKVSCWRSAS